MLNMLTRTAPSRAERHPMRIFITLAAALCLFAATSLGPVLTDPVQGANDGAETNDGPAKPSGKRAAIPIGMQPAGLEGVVGGLWDRSATARICRKNGKCIPGDGTDIETGDTIQAPNLVLLNIEDPDGYSKHGLTGEITGMQLVKLDDGSLALNLALSQGKMEGTIRKLTHVIRIGSVYCLANEADYVAEATETRGLFEIERGSGLCYEGTRRVRVDKSNPRFEWEFLPASPATEGGEEPDTRAIEGLPDIRPF